MEKIKFINRILLSILLISTIILVLEIIKIIPKINESTQRLNNAKCLESYHNQGQPPAGACGYNF